MPNTRRAFLRLVVLAAGGSLLAACAPGAPAAPTKPASTAAPAQAAAPKAGGTLTIAQVNDPGYLALNAIGTDTYNATHHIFDSLLRYDDAGKFVPGLAESWSTSQDGLTWSFKLRKGVKFHNGEDFTADAD